MIKKEQESILFELSVAYIVTNSDPFAIPLIEIPNVKVVLLVVLILISVAVAEPPTTVRLKLDMSILV